MIDIEAKAGAIPTAWRVPFRDDDPDMIEIISSAVFNEIPFHCARVHSPEPGHWCLVFEAEAEAFLDYLDLPALPIF